MGPLHPHLRFVDLPRYGKFAFTADKVLLTLWPRPCSTKIATTAIRARISAYSTKLWPFRDFNPQYSFWRVLFISFTSFIWLFRSSTTRRTYVIGKYSRRLRATFVLMAAERVVQGLHTIYNSLAANRLTGETECRIDIGCPVHFCTRTSFLPIAVNMSR